MSAAVFLLAAGGIADNRVAPERKRCPLETRATVLEITKFRDCPHRDKTGVSVPLLRFEVSSPEMEVVAGTAAPVRRTNHRGRN